MTTKNFKIGIAPDSFKGSLTAMEAAACIEKGLKRILTNISVVKVPMADGGEGTVRAIVDSTGGKIIRRTVLNPRGRKIKAAFGLSGDKKTAVIEMAEASGLALLKPKERNPMLTSTYGTGQLVTHALKAGAKKLLIGIGGSATNDGGTGMARALGVKFLNKQGRQIAEGGGSLQGLARIDMSGLDPRINRLEVEVACDVDNPLTGKKGASHVYGPQKGASPAMVKKLDAGLRNMARVIKHDISINILNVPGSGAAGGLGGGLMAFLGGQLRPGVDIVIDSVKLAQKFKGCDLVITGEGRMDGQTIYGKTPAGVTRVAKSLNIPVIAISGSVGKDVRKVLTIGIESYFSALQEPVEESMLPKRGPEMLEDCAEQVARLLLLKLPGRNRLIKKK